MTFEILPETEGTSDDVGRVRQGDILRWDQPDAPWRVLGVVVTADCDISHEKHDGRLSYVPVLALQEYWRLFTLPRKIRGYLNKKHRRVLFERIRALKRAHRPDITPEISDEGVTELLRLEPAQALDALGVPEDERDIPTRLIESYRAATSLNEQMGLRDLAEVLARMRVGQNPNTAPNVESELDDLPVTLGDLPGDAFFIGRIESVTAPGFVAYLRFVRELETERIAVSQREVRPGVTVVRRIARLRSPYLYRMTQQLAQVFSDIGLPSAYEVQRSTLAAEARTSIRAVSHREADTQ
jgi:hypothetical protein